MNRSQRSRRRLIIAGTLFGLIIISAAVMITVRAQVTGQVRTEARAAGIEAYQHGDYEEALHQLSYYLSNRDDDVEALLAFADSRSKIATDDHRHIIEPINLYNAVLALEPDNHVAIERLLPLYERTGRRLEWMEAAERLLVLRPDHVEALRLRATGFAFESEFDTAEVYIQRLIDLEPDNIEWRRFHLSISHAQDAPLQDLLNRCKAWIESYDGDGRYHMLKANVLAGAGHRDRAREAASQAAQHGAANRDVLQQMVSMLDILQLFDEAESLIRTTIERNPDEFWPYEAMVRRFWQQGRLSEALEVVEKVEAERDALSTSLLQWRSLLHVLRYELADAEEALTLLAEKAQQEAERRDSIRAWIQAARARIRMQQDDWLDTLSAYRTAISLDHQNPTLHFLIGEAYSQVGEFELALHALEQAVRNDPNWIAAQIMYIEALLRTGRYQTAARTASVLLQRSERPSLHLHLQFVRAVLGTRASDEQYDLVQHATGQRINLALYMEALHNQFSDNSEVNELLIQAYMRDGRESDARRHIQWILTTEDVPVETIITLARLSLQFDLGLELELLDRAREAGGRKLEIMELESRILHRDGQSDEGLELLSNARSTMLREARDAEEKDAALEQIDSIIIRYLATAELEQATEAMTRYLRHERSVERASLVLNQHMTWSDKSLADNAISILEEKLGKSSPSVVMARVRHTIQFRSDDDAALAKAMNDLNFVIQQISDSVEAHALMAALYLAGEPSLDAAIRHLERAVAAQPDRIDLYPQLIGLLQRNGDFTTAERYLRQMDRVAGSDDGLLRAQVKLYESQGDYEAIVSRLSGHAGSPQAEAHQLVLFRALHRTGRNAEAETLLQQLLNRSQPGDEVFFAAVDFYSKMNHHAKGLQLIEDRLLNERPGVAALLIGRIHDDRGSTEEAEKWLQQAVQKMPGDALAWNQLATHYLGREMFYEAKTTLERGLSYAGEHAELRTMLVIANLSLDDSSREHAMQMIEAFDRDDETIVRMLRLVEQLTNRPEGSPPGRRILNELREFVRDEPSFLHGWRLAISAHIEAGELDVANRLAQQAVGRFPADAGIAELATRVLMTMGEWAGAQEMARIWRRRSLDRPFEPDMLLAEISLRLGQPRTAADRLEPHIPNIINQRDRSPENLYTLLLVLLQSNQQERAATLGAPLLEESEQWLDLWIHAARNLTDEQIEGALSKLENVLPDSPAHQVRVAEEWGRLSARTMLPQHYRRSLELATIALQAEGDVSRRAHIVVAAIAELREDYQTAEKQYRAVLEDDPRNWRAMAFLARTLLAMNASKTEAYETARQAIEIEPDETSAIEAYANALLALDHTDEAVAFLGPRAERFFENRHDDPAGVMLWLRALIHADQADRANALMRRLLDDDADEWARQVLRLSRQLPATRVPMAITFAAEQLQQSPQGRLAIAAEWAMLGKRVGNEDYLNNALDEATRVYEQHAEWRPQSLMLRATVKDWLLDDHAAEAAYREVIQLQPDNWIAMNNLAAILLRRGGHTDEALRLSERAVRGGADVPELLDTRARALLSANRLDEAIMSVQRALEAYPTRSAFLLTLAEIALASEQPDKARESFAAAENTWRSEGKPDRLLEQQMIRVRDLVSNID